METQFSPNTVRLTPGAYCTSAVWGLMQRNFCVEWEVVWKYLHAIKLRGLTVINGELIVSEYQRCFPLCCRVYGFPRPPVPYFVVRPGSVTAQGPKTLQ